eukprot:1138339-Pelagomonas_calceolata.AAC.9
MGAVAHMRKERGNVDECCGQTNCGLRAAAIKSESTAEQTCYNFEMQHKGGAAATIAADSSWQMEHHFRKGS